MPEAFGSWRGSHSASRTTQRRRALALASSASLLALGLTASAVQAQTAGLQPGEAVLTRFSGAVAGPGGPQIDASGTVASIVDVRRPGRPPQGEHWVDEPQRRPVTAAEVGQVFGVTLDEASPPNIYLAATSAFGLHVSPATGQWMPGMWGPGGGPGTIWRLDAADGYRAKPFADVKLGGRANTGAALGNLAYDKTARQLYVSDLESGTIHRFDAASGADLGVWDHGTMARPSFLDATTGQTASLAAIAFDPATSATYTGCAAGPFERTPSCWNLAAAGRRVWGLAVRLEPGSSSRRLYYAVWSGPGTSTAWDGLPDAEKRGSVWSVGLAPDGAFVAGDVRREFLLPDFFAKPEDVARAGYGSPVADITFSDCSSKPVMLVSERGGQRNLGLGVVEAFAWPHEARTLRYEMDQAGDWRPVGRYDVGFYDRRKEGIPYLRANGAGGAAFGYGYKADFSEIDRKAPGEFVWITGDALCSPDGPCRMPGAAEGKAENAAAQAAAADGSEVHGLQGFSVDAVDALVPKGAFADYPQNSEPYPAIGPEQAWMIDADRNVDASGNPIEAEFTRNDATLIGDVAIHAICNPPRAPKGVDLLPVVKPAPVGVVTVVEGHDRALTHATVASHGATSSHFRIASHDPWASHDRWRSHNRWRSHDVVMSRPIHRPIGSWHRPAGSYHRPVGSVHRPLGSFHRPIGSLHRPVGSWHKPPGSIHRPAGSFHKPVGSLHRPLGSMHKPVGSLHRPPGSLHQPRGSIHRPPGSLHKPVGSLHRPPGSLHRPVGSVHRPPGSLHKPVGSVHRPPGSLHRPVGSVHRPPGSIQRPPVGIHRPAGSIHRPPVGIHRPAGSIHRPPVNVHRPAGSIHRPPAAVHRPPGSAVRPPAHFQRPPPARVQQRPSAFRP